MPSVYWKSGRFYLAGLVLLTIFALGCVTVAPGGNGTGTVTGGGLNCNWNGAFATGFCSSSFGPSTITANPGPGSFVAGWTGCAPNDNPVSCTPDYTIDFCLYIRVLCFPVGLQNVNAGVTFSTGLPTLTVTPQNGFGANSGRITGGGLDCLWSGVVASGTCSTSFASIGASVVLTVSSVDALTNVSFRGCDSEAFLQCTVTGNANRNVRVTFSGSVFPFSGP